MEERRSFVRVKADIHTGIEKIDRLPETWGSTASAYLTPSTAALPTNIDRIGTDDMLRLLFSAIGEIKEDIEQIKESLGVTERALSRTPVTISGSGIASEHFPSSLSPGDTVIVSIVLPLQVPVKVKAAGTVRTGTAENGTSIPGIQFSMISDDDRELIIRYTFQRQRELINAEKQNDSGATS